LPCCKNIDVDGDGDGDARARGPFKTSEIANRLTDEIERTVKAAGQWPASGWNRFVVAAQVTQLMRQGVSYQLIVDTVRIVAARCPGPKISSFRYCHDEIMRAHQEAAEQLGLRFPPHEVKHHDRSKQRDRQSSGRSEIHDAAAQLVELARNSAIDGCG
jgi:hypothetical protein